MSHEPFFVEESAARHRAGVCRLVLTTLLGLACLAGGASADGTPTFFRGINLNGPPVRIDGHPWDGGDAKWMRSSDRGFDNQKVTLVPPTDPERAKMIRSSLWGGGSGKNSVELLEVPRGRYSVFLYVWEDNNPETFSVSLNGRVVVPQHNSGTEGSWKKLGPWVTDVRDGAIRLASQGGAANFSGVEIWKGEHDGSDPAVNTPENIAFFESRIRPLLVKHCYECHSAESPDVQGALLVDSRAPLAKGGDHGPAVVPFEPARSLLIEAVRYKNGDLQMPPDQKLSEQEIQDLERWIRLGAPDPRSKPTRISRKTIDLEKGRDFWSLKPITDPKPPRVTNDAWPQGDLDRFILAKIEAAGLSPAADADKTALLRRVTFDLTGLPPTPEALDAFLKDESPGALAKVVDRLLDSPQYGERWGRYWLDVVRYSDTAGDNSDFPIPQMYRYRNWVIDALNCDLPYDEFVREQLAGDLLPSASEPERISKLVATGYIANARRFGSRVDDYPQHLTIEDTIDNLGRAFLGMSLNCARCHDHKFDPVSTEDYYGLYGIFQSTRYPWPGIELEQKQRDLVPLCSAEKVERVQQERQQRQNELDREVKRIEKERKGAKGEDRKRLDEGLRKAREAAERHSREPLPYELAYAVAEGASIDDAAVQKKGDPAQAGDIVHRRFLSVMGGQELPESDRTSGRRQLADWIVDRSNPLTARVIANRLWLYHFGRGLVSTPNDFGRQGKPPTHPELLDWLASRLMESGWSLKSLHRTIVLSRTYRLSSRPGDEALARDPGNELLTSFPCRRLDADAIRDTLLVLGGNLDPSPGGPHPFPPQAEWKFTQHNPFKAVYDTNRRSVYLMTQRIQRHPYLAIFDGADPATSTGFRGTSTTPLQALYLLNDPFVHQQAERFADRLLKDGGDEHSRIDRACRLALGRPAKEDEIAAGTAFLQQTIATLKEVGTNADQIEAEAWRAYVRAIFRLNEFVYVD